MSYSFWHAHTYFQKYTFALCISHNELLPNYYSSSQPQVHCWESAGYSSAPPHVLFPALLLHLLQLLPLILNTTTSPSPPSLIDLTTCHFTFLLLTSPPPPPPPPYLCSPYFSIHHLSISLQPLILLPFFLSPSLSLSQSLSLPLSLSSGPGLRHR